MTESFCIPVGVKNIICRLKMTLQRDLISISYETMNFLLEVLL